MAGDLALLRKNLAKMRKGKMGKGLHDVLIEEFEWVRKISNYYVVGSSLPSNYL